MDYLNLSKIISYALRHSPESYNLVVDKEGWVDINTLLSSIRVKHNNFALATYDDVSAMIASNKKKRHEIRGQKIRALYGHSIEQAIEKASIEPPQFLYHGTTPQFFSLIMQEGLKKMGRQYVHLSPSVEQAIKVASRKTKEPIVLKIRALKAFAKGVRFYKEDTVWLCDFLPNNFIEMEN